MQRAEPDDRRETLGRLVRHPLRSHVLFKYAEGVTSPSAIAADVDAPLNLVSYHTQVLLRAGAIELVRTEPRRGAKEHFYRAVLSSLIEDAKWERLPLRLRRALARAVIDGAMRESADALARGGMDGPTTHLSRSYFVLDRRGRAELATLLSDTFTHASDIGRASLDRASDDGVPYELVVMSFERASSP